MFTNWPRTGAPQCACWSGPIFVTSLLCLAGRMVNVGSTCPKLALFQVSELLEFAQIDQIDFSSIYLYIYISIYLTEAYRSRQVLWCLHVCIYHDVSIYPSIVLSIGTVYDWVYLALCYNGQRKSNHDHCKWEHDDHDDPWWSMMIHEIESNHRFPHSFDMF